jgi:hypothetical protein
MQDWQSQLRAAILPVRLVGDIMTIISKALLSASLLVALPTAANAAALFQLDIYGPPSSNATADRPRFLLSNLSSAGETIVGFSLNFTAASNIIVDRLTDFTSVNGTAPSIDVTGYSPTGDNAAGTAGFWITYAAGSFQPTLDKSGFRAEFDLAGQSANLDFREILFDDNATATVTFGTGETVTFGLGSRDIQTVYTYTNINAVPEPASWAMMIGGFALAGGALRNRKVRPLATA